MRRRPSLHMTLGAMLAAMLVGCATPLEVDPLSILEPTAAPLPPIREDAASDLPAVEGLRALSGELRQIPLRWQPVLAGQTAGYIVERAREPDGPFDRAALIGGAFVTAFVDRGADIPGSAAALGDGETYFYRVRAVGEGGELGALHPPVEGRTAELPKRPDAVRAISHLPRRVALSWDPSSDPTVAGYRVTRSPSGRGEFLLVRELKGRFSTTWVDEGLGDLRVFHYRVAAVNAAGGVGEASAAERGVTKPEPLPPAETVAVAVGLGRNQVRWSPNVETDLAGYRVSRRGPDEAEAVQVVAELPPDADHFEDDTLAAGQPVAYSVVAFDRDGLVSAPSVFLEVESIGYAAAGELTEEGVLLRWADTTQSELAETRILRVGTLSREEVARVSESRFLDTTPAPSAGSYRYQLVGVRQDGSLAPPSAVIEIEPRPTPPVAAEGLGEDDPENPQDGG